MPRTVVVTGAGTGIGRAIALRFAADGDTVYVTGRRSEPLAQTAKLAERGEVHPVVCDGSDPGDLARLLAAVPEQVDVLVNNAGGNTDFDRDEPAAGDLPALAEQWRANFDANVLTAVLTTAALADRLTPRTGAVISMSSIAADRGAGSYGAAKAALANWNLSAAGSLGGKGVTTNVISPGYIADTEFFRDRMTDERRAHLVAETKTGRQGAPDDIAETAYFLAGPGARHITGQVLNVNGGAYTSR
ncbi:SDR family NAD(P)-dependent oxidoreductase [Flindersiella endophytica]